MNHETIIAIVDDDDGLRDSLQTLLVLHGFGVKSFALASEFLAQHLEQHDCALIDIHMPGMNGIELLEKLGQSEHRKPCIMMTGQGDVGTAVRAMKMGAADFIEKPFDVDTLVETIKRNVSHVHKSSTADSRAKEASSKIERLTARERDVLVHLAQGQPSKVIAHELGISPRTVEVHRARVMEKLGAGNTAEAVRIAVEARLMG
jgi:two-component system, LuxR family, response regulator FixJ